MAFSAGTVYLDVKPNMAGFNSQIASGVNQQSGGIKGTFSGLGKQIGAGIVGGFAAAKAISVVTDFVKSAIAGAEEARKVAAQTDAVIKSTGAIAGVSASQVSDLANAIKDKTAIDDEAIQSGENLLLTFTNLRNEVGAGNDIFNQATETMVDMSAALGQDMKSSAIQLGKALNDPIKGITALQRVGVSFTQQQRDQITAMVQSGNTLQAQQTILAELNKEFGGSAEAQVTAFDKLRQTWDDAAEELGTALLPILDSAANVLGQLAPVLTLVTKNLGALTAGIGAWLILGKALPALLSGISTGFMNMATTAGATTAGAFITTGTAASKMGTFLSGAAGVISAVAVPAVMEITGLMNNFSISLDSVAKKAGLMPETLKNLEENASLWHNLQVQGDMTLSGFIGSLDGTRDQVQGLVDQMSPFLNQLRDLGLSDDQVAGFFQKFTQGSDLTQDSIDHLTEKIQDNLGHIEYFSKRLGSGQLVGGVHEYARQIQMLGFNHQQALALADHALDQYGFHITKAGKKVRNFAGMTSDELKTWVEDTQSSFLDFIDNVDRTTGAFKAQTGHFIQDLRARARVARQVNKDLQKLDEDTTAKQELGQRAAEDFTAWLGTQGAQAVRDYAHGTDEQQKMVIDNWKVIRDSEKGVGDQLSALTRQKAEPKLDLDTSLFDSGIGHAKQELLDMGFKEGDIGNVIQGLIQKKAHTGGYMPNDLTNRAAGAMSSDEFMAVLRKGEFVVRPEVVRKPGVLDALMRLNQGRGIDEYHTGGIVNAPAAVASLGAMLNNAPTYALQLPKTELSIPDLFANITGGGIGGLSPNAARYEAVIRSMWPGIPMGDIARRTILGTNTWSQHAYGNAVDVMTGANTALRSAIASFTNANRTMLSIAHLLADPWYPSPLGNHYNHVHADFNPQGTGTPLPGGGWSGFSEGGIVRRPVNAVVGEAGPEAVIPLNRPMKIQGDMTLKDLRRGIVGIDGEIGWTDRTDPNP